MKYLVKVNLEFTCIVEADTPEAAIAAAPSLPAFGDWEERNSYGHEAEEVAA